MNDSDSSTDFTTYLPSPLRQYARLAIAARRTRLENLSPDPPVEPTFDDSDEDARRLAGLDLTEKLIEEFGAKTIASWVRSYAALRGESV
jgi:hypothetical protein